MKTFLLLAVVVVLVVGLLLGGCAKPAPTPPAPTPTPPAPAPTPPTQPIKLTYGSTFPATHPLELVNQEWIDKIQKDTNGRVQITLYSAETLIHMMTAWDELKGGVADIANFSMMSAKYGFTIGRALVTFLYGTDAYVARQIYEGLRKGFPEIEAEFEGVKVLWYRGSVSNYIFTKKPIRTLDDLKGLQLQEAPSWPGLVEKLGSTSVRMPFMEIYPSLQKGIIDGTFMPADILKGGNLYEVVGYGMDMHSAAPPSTYTIMNQNSWNRLPPDIQKVFEASAPWVEDKVTKVLLQADQDAINLGKSKGVQLSELSPADLNKLYSYLDEISLKKAAELDAQKLPGTKIYSELKRLKGEYTKK